MHAEIERAVIGCFLTQGDQCRELYDLDEKHFADQRHAVAFDGIRELVEDSEPVDLVTVVDKLAGDVQRAGGRTYLAELAAEAPWTADVGHFAKLLRKASARREFELRLVATLERARAGEDIAELAAELAEGPADDARTEWVGAEALMRQVGEHLDSDKPTGLPVGFPSVDRHIGGMDPGSVHIVAARPGMGKTAAALRIARSVSALGRGTVLVIQLEMTEVSLGMRMVAAEAAVSGNKIRSRTMSDGDRELIREAMPKIAALDFRVVMASALTPGKLNRMVEAEQRKGPVSMVIVDYLQLIRGTGGTSYERTTSVSRGIKEAAAARRVPFVVLSQLNRSCESRPNKRPILADLRESGAIEEDAETVSFLYRDAYYNLESDERDLEWILSKNRNGSTGTVHLHWYGSLTSIEEPKQL